MKKAFTLVELLLVIGIIAVLAGVFLAMTGGGTESARAAQCMTNMRNLVTACNTYAMSSGWYPVAGSYERKKEYMDGTNPEFVYYEDRGWISWNSNGAYSGKKTSHVSSASWFTSSYNQDIETRDYVLKSGSIWGSLSGSSSVYLCPNHLRACSRDNKPLWSYVMNSAFGWDTTEGANGHVGRRGIKYGTLSNADKRLMFAELQFLKNDKVDVNMDRGSGLVNDCTLQYGRDEIIGFNHPNGKRGLCAHVAFADGHVEKLTIPGKLDGDTWKVGMSVSALKDLTTWLCQGNDITFTGDKYELIEN